MFKPQKCSFFKPGDAPSPAEMYWLNTIFGSFANYTLEKKKCFDASTMQKSPSCNIHLGYCGNEMLAVCLVSRLCMDVNEHDDLFYRPNPQFLFFLDVRLSTNWLT